MFCNAKPDSVGINQIFTEKNPLKRQQASNDIELCKNTVEACYRGLTVEKAKQLLESESGTQFLETMTKIITSIVEYCKDAAVLPVSCNSKF